MKHGPIALIDERMPVVTLAVRQVPRGRVASYGQIAEIVGAARALARCALRGPLTRPSAASDIDHTVGGAVIGRVAAIAFDGDGGASVQLAHVGWGGAFDVVRHFSIHLCPIPHFLFDSRLRKFEMVLRFPSPVQQALERGDVGDEEEPSHAQPRNRTASATRLTATR